MADFAVIDVGSNSIVLCTYQIDDASADAALPPACVSPLTFESFPARLASYVQDGEMSQDGISAAEEAISRYLAQVGHIPAHRIGIFATAAIRNSRNNTHIASTLKARCGHNVHILTGAEEAHLGFVGVTSATPINNGLLLDIGGASTELTTISNGYEGQSVSLPIGALAASEQFVAGPLPSPAEEAALVQEVRALIDASGLTCTRPILSLVGASGSIRAALRLLGTKVPLVTRAGINALISQSHAQPEETLQLVAERTPNRLRTAIPGCIILREVMDWANCDSIMVSPNGIREGYLIEHLLAR